MNRANPPSPRHKQIAAMAADSCASSAPPTAAQAGSALNPGYFSDPKQAQAYADLKTEQANKARAGRLGH